MVQREIREYLQAFLDELRQTDVEVMLSSVGWGYAQHKEPRPEARVPLMNRI